MSQSLTISDELYARLQAAARQRGLSSVQELLESWNPDGEPLSERSRAVDRIDALRQRLLAIYGEMPDSTALVREDRAR